MIIRFDVPCVPVAQPRQRHRVLTVAGRTFAQNYCPKNSPVNTFKAAVQLAASQAYSGAPLDGPLSVTMDFIMPRPSTRPSWIKRGNPWYAAWTFGRRVPHIGRPDRDNLMKSFQDALNGWWRDDSILFDGPTSKWIAALAEQPHVEIKIETLEV